MFGVSITELIVVFVVALLLFGPEQLPQLARTIGKMYGEFRKGSDSLRREFYNSVYKPSDDFGREFRELGRELRSTKLPPPAPPVVPIEPPKLPPDPEMPQKPEEVA